MDTSIDPNNNYYPADQYGQRDEEREGLLKLNLGGLKSQHNRSKSQDDPWKLNSNRVLKAKSGHYEDELDPHSIDQSRADIGGLADKFREMQEKMPEKTCLQRMVGILNYLSCLTMWTVAAARFITYDAKAIYMDGFYVVFTCYLGVFGVLLASAEYEFTAIIKYLACLTSSMGKGFFQILIGLLLFDNKTQMDLIGSLSLTIIGLLNLSLACCRKTRRPDRADQSRESMRAEQERERARQAQNAAQQVARLSPDEKEQLAALLSKNAGTGSADRLNEGLGGMARSKEQVKQQADIEQRRPDLGMLEGGSEESFEGQQEQRPCNLQAIYDPDVALGRGHGGCPRGSVRSAFGYQNDLQREISNFTYQNRPRQTVGRSTMSLFGSKGPSLLATGHSATSAFDYYEERVKRMKQAKSSMQDSHEEKVGYEAGHKSGGETSDMKTIKSASAAKHKRVRRKDQFIITL